MKTCSIKLTVFITLSLMLAILPCAWSAGTNNMMGGGGNNGGGNTTTTMMGGGRGGTTTIPGGSSNTTTTVIGGGIGGGMMGGGIGGGMMGGGGMMMNQFKVADLNGDGVPEIAYIAAGSYLVILDNTGKVISSKLLPAIPGLTNKIYVRASGIDIADLDEDKIPEIITMYWTFNGTYLVILDNQGNYKSSQKLPYIIY